jgi:hypothetical protein
MTLPVAGLCNVECCYDWWIENWLGENGRGLEGMGKTTENLSKYSRGFELSTSRTRIWSVTTTQTRSMRFPYKGQLINGV